MCYIFAVEVFKTLYNLSGVVAGFLITQRSKPKAETNVLIEDFCRQFKQMCYASRVIWLHALKIKPSCCLNHAICCNQYSMHM